MATRDYYKIAFIGSHGVGKTTLCFGLAARLKTRDLSLEVVHEVARRCPLPINTETTFEAQAWIAHTQIAEELLAQARQELVKLQGGDDENLGIWKEMIRLLEAVDRPNTLGFQADMAHTLLYLLGYNAPGDAILPAEFDWSDEATLDSAYKTLTDAQGEIQALAWKQGRPHNHSR